MRGGHEDGLGLSEGHDRFVDVQCEWRAKSWGSVTVDENSFSGRLADLSMRTGRFANIGPDLDGMRFSAWRVADRVINECQKMGLRAPSGDTPSTSFRVIATGQR